MRDKVVLFLTTEHVKKSMNSEKVLRCQYREFELEYVGCEKSKTF